MKWVTRHNPHADRCASIWLIKIFMDRDAVFGLISRDDPVPERSIPVTLLGAEIGQKMERLYMGIQKPTWKIVDFSKFLHIYHPHLAESRIMTHFCR